MRFVLLLLLFSTNLTAQIIQNVELEVVGKPSWQNIIPIGKNGLLLFVKTDQAKAKAVMYDGDLQKKMGIRYFFGCGASSNGLHF